MPSWFRVELSIFVAELYKACPRQGGIKVEKNKNL